MWFKIFKKQDPRKPRIEHLECNRKSCDWRFAFTPGRVTLVAIAHSCDASVDGARRGTAERKGERAGRRRVRREGSERARGRRRVEGGRAREDGGEGTP